MKVRKAIRRCPLMQDRRSKIDGAATQRVADAIGLIACYRPSCRENQPGIMLRPAHGCTARTTPIEAAHLRDSLSRGTSSSHLLLTSRSNHSRNHPMIPRYPRSPMRLRGLETFICDYAFSNLSSLGSSPASSSAACSCPLVWACWN